MVYNIKSAMGSNRKALRLCQALRGSMVLEDLPEIQDNSMEIPQSCKLLWMPIFKTTESLKGENWVDDNSSSVHFITWHPGQPNGCAFEKMCAVADELFE